MAASLTGMFRLEADDTCKAWHIHQIRYWFEEAIHGPAYVWLSFADGSLSANVYDLETRQLVRTVAAHVEL